MRLDIDKANRITLNLLKDTLEIHTSKTNFLRLLFPETLRLHDEKSVLSFVFDDDCAFQNTRSIFLNGNIIKKKGSTYSRAHQAALDYIARQITTGTVFQEMNELVCYNFTQSQTCKLLSLIEIDRILYPSEFYDILQSSAKTDSHLLLIWLVMWSIFGERITLLSPYHYVDNHHTNVIFKTEVPSLHNAVEQFIRKKLKECGIITEVNLAFNHGVRWLTHHDRTQLLRQIIERANCVNILMSEYQIAEEFTKHQRKPGTYYISSYVPPQKMWQEFIRESPGKITLKLSPIPVLRQYISFHFEDEMDSALYVGFYTYGGSGFDNNPFQMLSYNENYYNVYEKEFSYLWSISQDITDFTGNTMNEIN